MAGLRTQNLVKSFRSRKVVNRVSIEVKQGEIVGLLGPNGAGKTTTFYMVVGLTCPDEGQVLLNDDDVTNFPMHKRAKKGVSYLPQEPSVFRKLTVEENILVALESQKLSAFDRKKKARSLLREMNILHIKDSMAYTLSGGERRRVEISRALATSPVFILLDEPFAGIDPISVIDIQDIIKILPHRYPFVLIDRIDEVKQGEYVNAIKNVTINEPFFQGHFPGQPVMPGVLSLESMAQATAFLMLHELDDPLKKNMFISGVDKVRYRRLIIPGDTLNINIRLVSKKLTLYKFDGTIKINGQLAVQAKISSNLVDRVEV